MTTSEHILVVEDEEGVRHAQVEMLTALEHVDLDASILMLLPPVIEDPDPLVRFRIAELLGNTDPTGNEKVLAHLSSDADELVRRVAGALRVESANE